MKERLVKAVKAKLISNGFNGLYYPGECACDIDDFAPCGTVERERGEDYMNGCEPGYKHCHSKDPQSFCISARKEPPLSDDEMECYL